MFDFEKLEVYQLVRQTNVDVLKFVLSGPVQDDYLLEQLKKATVGMQLHLAEGSGRFNSQDKKQCIIISRSSAFECVALLDVLRGLERIDPQRYETFYTQYEQISKMLLGLYRNVKED